MIFLYYVSLLFVIVSLDGTNHNYY